MKRPMILAGICLALSLLLLWWGFEEGPPAPEKGTDTVVLLVENETGAFLLQLKKGAQEAAAQQGIKVKTEVMTPDDLEVQAIRLKHEGVAAALVYAQHPQGMLAALDGAGLTTVLIDQEEQGQAGVVPDQQQGGALLGQAALGYGGDILLVRDAADGWQTQASQGFVARTPGAAVRQVAVDQGLTAQEMARAGVVVALSPRATLACARLKQAEDLAVPLLGYDTGEDRVDMLESGRVQAMVFASPYAMGYRALGLSLVRLQGEGAQTLTTEMVLITRENMYLAQHVKQVFPLLQ